LNRKGYIGIIILALYASLGLAQSQVPIDTVCIFDPASRYAVPQQADMRYEWSVGQGQITSNPTDSNVIWVSWANASAGLHTLRVVAIDAQSNCPGDTSEALVLVTAPKTARAKYPDEACVGDVIILESSISGSFMWKGGSTNRYQSFVATSDTSTYLIALNGSCANDTVAFTIRVNESPEGRISRVPDTVIYGNELKLYFQGQASNEAIIDWYLNGAWVDQGRAIELEFYTFGKNEIMQVVSNGNCMDTVYKYLYVDDEFTAHFPNAFTPNKDGRNDIWNFTGVGHKSYVAGVYNRWGELIYQWTETSNQKGWDGTENGQPSLQGSYVYKVEIEDMRGKMHYYTNYLTLLR